MSIPRPEHPKPQFMRSDWINLNGQWQFEFDNSRSGIARGVQNPDYRLSGEITVPFCPESKLSGIENTDFILGEWYKKDIDIPKSKLSGKIILHFGAVDYFARIFVNGKEAGCHKGGYVSFEIDITDFVAEGTNQIAVYVEDDTRDPLIPCGKQSGLYHSYGCCYTRTTGIWQTVWIEFKPQSNIKNVKFTPDVQTTSVTVAVDLEGQGNFEINVTYQGKEMANKKFYSIGGHSSFTLELEEAHLWEVGKGRLYDVELTYGEDKVTSYFGLRTVKLEGLKFLINGKSVFQRLILDQGFYPDGIYTAPSDEALENDIKLSMAMGFNGARLHEKIFEERFLYHCDRLGYIVWSEYPNWGLENKDARSFMAILPEWCEEVKRDYNHPAIIGWCPFNETHADHNPQNLSLIYDVTKQLDPTRPCIDTSGYIHVKTDIFDLHEYDQDPVTFAQKFEKLSTEGKFENHHNHLQTYKGEPIFVSEYGGIQWTDKGGWGYGNAPKTEEEFIARYKGLTDVLLDNPSMFALCYTQLTDVEQEQNGLYTYERVAKFPPEILAPIMSRKAAIED